MKAIRVHEFGNPEVMKWETVGDPTPAAGQITVNIQAAGVNPVESYIRAGGYARKPDLPYTPGSDGAGVVDAVGEGVGGFKKGDRVYTSGSISGTYAEKALCAKEQAHPLPDNVDFRQGAALGVPYATAYRALFQKAEARPSETVLIHGGSGGVGVAAIQLALAAGCSVIATAGSETGRALIASQGVVHVLDHTVPGYLDGIKTITRNSGVDVIVELLANSNLANDLKILAPKGRIVVVGSRGAILIDPRDLMARDAAIVGMVLFNAQETELLDIHAALKAGLSNKTLIPIIGKEFPLREAAQAHRRIMEERAYGKVVLIP